MKINDSTRRRKKLFVTTAQPLNGLLNEKKALFFDRVTLSLWCIRSYSETHREVLGSHTRPQYEVSDYLKLLSSWIRGVHK